MSHPWLFVSGCVLLGWLLPEIGMIFGKIRVPALMNLISAIACGLIAASFVL